MEPIPVRQEQVDAACRFHERLEQWKRSDAALIRLRDALPELDTDACLLKAVAVNTLYSTQVMAIVRMGEHVCQKLQHPDLASAGPELVEAIADLPQKEGTRARRFTSFAAKFCHFFVDERRFPIYDEAARDALSLHLGPDRTDDGHHPYSVFCARLQQLRDASQIGVDGRELDRYLWITGMYMKWKREPTKVNVELARALEQMDEETSEQLKLLLPAGIDQHPRSQRKSRAPRKPS